LQEYSKLRIHTATIYDTEDEDIKELEKQEIKDPLEIHEVVFDVSPIEPDEELSKL
jgi:hypothetical protein